MTTGQILPPVSYLPDRLFLFLFVVIALLMVALWWHGRNRD